MTTQNRTTFHVIARWCLIFGIVIVGFASDMISKRVAQSQLRGVVPRVVVPGFLDVAYTENRGMVFGILNDGHESFIDTLLKIFRICIVVSIPFFVFALRKRSTMLLCALASIFAGALGNSLDTLRHGFVVDFIHIHCFTIADWPFLFNLADVYLLAGMVLLLMGSEKKKIVTVESAV